MPADSPPDLASAVRATAERYALWRPGDGVLVAVSGGLDSVTLLDVLRRISAEDDLRLVVAHFDHRLREDSADDAAFVASLAAAHGLPFVLGNGDVAAEARRLGRGLEAGARSLRLGFLATSAERQGCSAVALAHTADDRAETVVLNLLRGSGLWGLQGMPAVRRPFVRPLLSTWRREIEAYALAEGLAWREDRTNFDTTRFLRNKIRHELLPLLEAEYHTGAAEALVRCAAAVEAELAWSEDHVAAALEAAAAEVSDGALVLRPGPIAGLPKGLLVRVLRAAAVLAFGDVADWSAASYAALADLVADPRTGRSAMLPGGLEAKVSYGLLRIGEPTPLPDPLTSRALPVPGEASLPEIGMVLRATIVSQADASARGTHTALLSPDLADGLVVRGWQPGDRFSPSGLGGTKKLQDFFTDEKVPRELRPLVPLVVHPRLGIIWVAGMRLAAHVDPEQDDAGILMLSLAPAKTGLSCRPEVADGAE